MIAHCPYLAIIFVFAINLYLLRKQFKKLEAARGEAFEKSKKEFEKSAEIYFRVAVKKIEQHYQGLGLSLKLSTSTKVEFMGQGESSVDLVRLPDAKICVLINGWS
jgi:hypothetical protein